MAAWWKSVKRFPGRTWARGCAGAGVGGEVGPDRRAALAGRRTLGRQGAVDEAVEVVHAAVEAAGRVEVENATLVSTCTVPPLAALPPEPAADEAPCGPPPEQAGSARASDEGNVAIRRECVAKMPGTGPS